MKSKPGTKEIDPNTVMVRARVRKHLANLTSRFASLADAKILALPGHDYGFRLIVPKAIWVEVLKEMAEEQTWSNFKNEAAARSADTGSEYVNKLHAVWREMLRLQESQTRHNQTG
jgi:pyocin large subunit-like protein